MPDRGDNSLISDDNAERTHSHPLALMLDADGVIQRTPPEFMKRLRGLLGDNQHHSDAFVTAVFKAEQPCLTGAADFVMEMQNLLTTWDLAVDVDQALEIWQLIEPIEEVLNLVSGLRQSGLPCYLASNQQAHRAAFMSESLGYCTRFDAEFYSCHLGARKPSHEYFERLISRSRLPADRLLFIDDHADNVAAARQCGLQAQLFNALEWARPGAELAGLLLARGVDVDSALLHAARQDPEAQLR